MPNTIVTNPPYNVVQPGAYSSIDASKLSSSNSGADQPIPCSIGTTLGGEPDTALYFTNAGNLQQVLKGGPGYDVARFMMDGGASEVCVVRVGDSITQASLALMNTATTPAVAVTLTANDYGSWANAIEVTVAAGPVITLQYTNSLGITYTETWDLTTLPAGVTLSAATIAAAINGSLYGYSQSNYVTAAAGSGAPPLATISATPLAGGTDGLAPAAGDWTNGLATIETEPISIIVPATSDATVHAQVVMHCNLMSASNARMERTMQYGGAIGETVQQAIARQAALQAARASLTYPGMYDYNNANQLTLYDSFYHAGKIAGMRCALPDVATSLVHASVPIVQAEFDLSTVQGGPLDQLLQAGVSPVAPQNGGSGYWVVDDLTGYVNAQDPNNTFGAVQAVRSADYVAQVLRTTLEAQYVGAKYLSASQASIEQTALEVVDSLVTDEIINAYQIPTVTPGPGGSGWTVTAPVNLIGTTKFIFITESLYPTATVTGSVTSTDTN